MDSSSDYPSTTSAGRSPRKELLGPRPAPLRIHKDSHKIKKPPVVPQPNSQQPPANPPRQPVIIYTVSPKIIHTNPSDFMNLVQRLTGLSSSEAATTTAAAGASNNNPLNDNNNNNSNSGAISPAARYSMIEKAKSSPRDQWKRSGQNISEVVGINVQGMMEMDGHDHHHVESSKGLFPGILSPGPALLPPVAPPNFFSPPSDSFFHDLSPVLHGINRNFFEGSYMPSPSYFASPTPSIDLFNNFPDNL